jgi:hypothetical protein
VGVAPSSRKPARRAAWRLWVGEFGELGGVVAVVRGDSAGPPESVGLAGLLPAAPDARVITIPGDGGDVVATAPAALAAALDELLTTTAVEES